MNKEHPRRSDILFGRGSDCWNHCGNKRFRLIIAKYQEKYHSKECRSEKMTVVAEIVEEIRSSGARFLRRNGDSKAWEEVDRKSIVEKVRRSLPALAASLTSFILYHTILILLNRLAMP
jgi:hypothetical protein